MFNQQWGQEREPAGGCWDLSSALKPSQARLIPAAAFKLPCFIPAFWGSSQTLADPNQSGCCSSDLSPTLAWFSSELTGRKKDICRSTVIHEQNKSQPSPSCKVSMFGRSSKEQSEEKPMYLNRCFYRAGARTAFQTPG